jgi:hypothetical protein
MTARADEHVVRPRVFLVPAFLWQALTSTLRIAHEGVIIGGRASRLTAPP